MPWYAPSAGGSGTGAAAVSISGSVPTAADLPTQASTGSAYLSQDTGHLWVWDGTQFIDAGTVGGSPGPAGPVGPTPVLTGGTVSTLAYGQPATAALVDTGNGTYRLDLGLPAGQPGSNGQIRFTGHGVPATIVGSSPGDYYLDLDTYILYQLG